MGETAQERRNRAVNHKHRSNKFSCYFSNFVPRGRKSLNKTSRANAIVGTVVSCCRFLSTCYCQMTDKLQTQQRQGALNCETSGLLLQCSSLLTGKSPSYLISVEQACRVSSAPQNHLPVPSRICHAASVPQTLPQSPALSPLDGF